MDAKTIITALDIEDITKGKAYTIIELLNSKNESHAKHAKVDEIIFYDDFAAKLLATSANNKGISKLFSDLLSFDNTDEKGEKKEGYEFYTSETPPAVLVGKSFKDVIEYYRRQTGQGLPIALLRNEKKDLFINPDDKEVVIQKEDQIIYIAKERIS